MDEYGYTKVWDVFEMKIWSHYEWWLLTLYMQGICLWFDSMLVSGSLQPPSFAVIHRQTLALGSPSEGPKWRSLVSLPFPLIKFQIETLSNFLSGVLIYIPSPSRKDLKTAPKISTLENIQRLGIIICQEKQIGLKTNGGIIFLKQTTNCLPFSIEDKKLLPSKAACSQQRAGQPQRVTL